MKLTIIFLALAILFGTAISVLPNGSAVITGDNTLPGPPPNTPQPTDASLEPIIIITPVPADCTLWDDVTAPCFGLP